MALYTKQIEKVDEVFAWTPEAAIAQNIMDHLENPWLCTGSSSIGARQQQISVVTPTIWRHRHGQHFGGHGQTQTSGPMSWSSERSRSTKSAMTAIHSGSPSRAIGRALQRRWSWLAGGASTFERSTMTGWYIEAYGGALAPTWMCYV